MCAVEYRGSQGRTSRPPLSGPCYSSLSETLSTGQTRALPGRIWKLDLPEFAAFAGRAPRSAIMGNLMLKTPDPFRFLLIVVGEWMNQYQLQVIKYIRDENRVRRQQLGGRRRDGTT